MFQENVPQIIFNNLYTGIYDIHATKEFDDKETMVSEVKRYIDDKELDLALGEDLVYFKGVMSESYTAFLLDVESGIVFYFSRDKRNHMQLARYFVKKHIDTFRQIGIAPTMLIPMVYRYAGLTENEYTLVFKFKESLILATSPTNNYYYSSEFDVNTCGDLDPAEPWSLFANLVKTKNFKETFKNTNINSDIREVVIESYFSQESFRGIYDYVKVFTIEVHLAGVNESVGCGAMEKDLLTPSFSKVKTDKLTFEIKIPYKLKEGFQKLSPLTDEGYFVVIAKLLAKLNQNLVKWNYRYFDVLRQKIEELDICEQFFDDIVDKGGLLKDPEFLLNHFELN